MASTNPEFLPHYVTLSKFSTDLNRFNTTVILNGLVRQILELLWNITIESSDILYTDALEFYNSVQEAARRRVDAAEAIYNQLNGFFKSKGRKRADAGEAPTYDELVSDFKKAARGKINAEIAVRSVKPKITAGRREVIDKKITESEQFKDTAEGEIKE
jgi:hypothetical protein